MSPKPLADIPNPQTRVDEFDLRLRRGSAGEVRHTLLEAMADTYPPLRHRAGLAAAERDDAPFDAVLRALADGDAEAAVDAAVGLELDPAAPPSPLAPVRQVACLALRRSDTPETHTVLLRATRDDDADVRYQALVSLHELDATGRQFRDAVVERLGDEDSEVAVVAAQICAQRGWTDQTDHIVERWRELGGSDRLQLALSLTELVGDHGASLPSPTLTEIVDQLIDALGEETTIAAAAQALVQLGSARAEKPLEDVLDRWFAHPILKVEAAGALHALNNARGTAYLQKSLSSSRKDARGYALRLVGRLHIGEFFDELARVAHSDDYHADTAVLALADYNTQEARAVLEDVAAGHPDNEVRTLAQDVLKP